MKKPTFVVDFLAKNTELAAVYVLADGLGGFGRPVLVKFLQKHTDMMRKHIGQHSWDTLSTSYLYPEGTVQKWLHEHPDTTAD